MVCLKVETPSTHCPNLLVDRDSLSLRLQTQDPAPEFFSDEVQYNCNRNAEITIIILLRHDSNPEDLLLFKYILILWQIHPLHFSFVTPFSDQCHEKKNLICLGKYFKIENDEWIIFVVSEKKKSTNEHLYFRMKTVLNSIKFIRGSSKCEIILNVLTQNLKT